MWHADCLPSETQYSKCEEKLTLTRSSHNRIARFTNISLQQVKQLCQKMKREVLHKTVNEAEKEEEKEEGVENEADIDRAQFLHSASSLPDIGSIQILPKTVAQESEARKRPEGLRKPSSAVILRAVCEAVVLKCANGPCAQSMSFLDVHGLLMAYPTVHLAPLFPVQLHCSEPETLEVAMCCGMYHKHLMTSRKIAASLEKMAWQERELSIDNALKKFDRALKGLTFQHSICVLEDLKACCTPGAMSNRRVIPGTRWGVGGTSHHICQMVCHTSLDVRENSDESWTAPFGNGRETEKETWKPEHSRPLIVRVLWDKWRLCPHSALWLQTERHRIGDKRSLMKVRWLHNPNAGPSSSSTTTSLKGPIVPCESLSLSAVKWPLWLAE
ncbi:hypothetical protein PAMP_015495 [Pampus punctatissimus]